MRNLYIITRSMIKGRSYILYIILDENRRMTEIVCEREDQKSILGNMYIGRVKDVVLNLNAAFIEIGNGRTCYYSMEDYRHPLFTKKNGKKPLCCGDELVVQVSKEAVKTKFPVVTTNLNFTGKYLVLTTENTGLGVSNKLPKDKKAELKALLTDLLSREKEAKETDFGLVVRTNAGNADSALIFEEYRQLKEMYLTLKSTCIHKTAFSLLKQAKPFYLKELEGASFTLGDKVITDCADIYDELNRQHTLKQTDIELTLYADETYPLEKLYSIEKGLEDALKERVWLKSGAYLIISPTEALTVIDVNSGKNTKGKNAGENFLKINKEAALEIARQLRLRNISGICIVDFINMNTREDMDNLMHTFRMALKEDKVPVQLVDITKLGLVELTRKKVKRSLAEQINS